MISRIKLFFAESKQEFNKVNWPTFAETSRLTLIVIVFALFTALFLGILDTAFAYLIGRII